MKYLVTGGAGFIGSHLCKKLLNVEDEVICLDNLCTGKGCGNCAVHPGRVLVTMNDVDVIVFYMLAYRFDK